MEKYIDEGFAPDEAFVRMLKRVEGQYALAAITEKEERKIYFARKGSPLEGASIYVYPWHPCPECAKLLIQSGFSEVIHAKTDVPERWSGAFALANAMFAEAGVVVKEIKMED